MKRYQIAIAILIFLLMIPAIFGFSGYIYKVGDKISIGRYSNDFDGAITTIGSSNYTLVIDTNITVTQDVTVPATCGLDIGRGGSLTYQDANVDLTINGPVMAGPYQWIDPNRAWVSFGAGSIDKLYPQWWGAAGDGSTNDDTPLARWIAEDTGVKYLPKGSGAYIIQTALTLSNSNQVIEFEEGAELQLDANQATAGGKNALTITGDNVTLRNFKFNGNRPNQNTGKGHGLVLNGADHCKIYAPYIYSIKGGADCIYVYGDSNNVHIYNPVCIDPNRNGIAVTDARNVYIKNIYASGCNNAGIDIEPSAADKSATNIIVNGGLIDSCLYGAIGYGYQNTNYATFSFKNVTIESSGDSGIVVRAAKDFSVENCTINNAGSHGIFLETHSSTYPYYIKKGNVINSKIYNSTGIGIYVYGGSTTRYIEDVNIINNIIDTTGGTSAGISGTFINRGNFINNIIKNSAGIGLSLSSNLDISIGFNTIYDSGTHGVQIAGGSNDENTKFISNTLRNGTNDGLYIVDAYQAIIDNNIIDGFTYSFKISAASYCTLGDNSIFDPNTGYFEAWDTDTAVAHEYTSDEIDLTASGATICGPVFRNGILLVDAYLTYTEAYPWDANFVAATFIMGDADDTDKYITSKTLNASKSLGDITSTALTVRKFVADDMITFTHTQSDAASGKVRATVRYINTCN